MSLFAKAKTLETKITGKAKSDKQEVAMAGIQNLAEIEALIKNLESVKATLATQIKDLGFDEFLKMETQVRPESFKGIDGMATCSVEIRKRGTNSPLNADEEKILVDLGLKPLKQVVVTELFGINPVYAKDTKMMDKVSKSLEKIVPEDFFVHQEEVSKMVVDEPLANAAYAMTDAAKRRTALELVTTMALKPRLNADYDMAKLLENVTAFLAPAEEETGVVPGLEAEAVAIIAEKPAKAPRKAKVAATA